MRKRHLFSTFLRKARYNQVIQWFFILLLVLVVAWTPAGTALMRQGLVGPIPKDSGSTVDAIVVLGRGLGSIPNRADLAAVLWQRGRAPFIFASGLPEAEAIMRQLNNKDVPAAALQGEKCSLTTEENALFTAIALNPQGVRRILLVTDPLHMLRSLLTFRSLGFEVIPRTTSTTDIATSELASASVRRETAALLGYALLGRFWTRSFDNPRYLQPQRLRQAQMGGCAVTRSDSGKGN